MAYSITKQPDGDVSLGSVNGEFVVLQPSTSDYPPGGYAIVDGVSVVDNSALNANCDLYRVLTVLPAGLSGGYNLYWNQNTKKLQVFSGASGAGPDVEIAANTNLAASPFYLLLIGQ